MNALPEIRRRRNRGQQVLKVENLVVSTPGKGSRGELTNVEPR
jgi:hypothetical protein